MSVGVFCRSSTLVETAFGGYAPTVWSDTSELKHRAEALRQPWDWKDYVQLQHKSVQSALPGRPWYDEKLRAKNAPVGFESIVWPPSPAALQHLLHGDIDSIVAANTGASISPWIFRVEPCKVVSAVLGANFVFESDAGQLAIVGLPFPGMDAAGAALLKSAVSTGGIVQLSPKLSGTRLPQGHRRRSSVDSAEPKIWIGADGHAWVKLPYESKWKSPMGMVWPDATEFWTRAWPLAVEAKAKDVQDRRRVAFDTDGKQTKVSTSRILKLIKDLGLPESPTCMDKFGKPIGAERFRKRQAEWNRYLGRKFNAKYVPRCPSKHFANTSRNALVQFCPQSEHERCTRCAGATVAEVLAAGIRAPCIVRAIGVGGNNERYQAAGVLAYAAELRDKASNAH